ncbi:hypothetical protein LTR86_010566 [Recurvomyces mirabilis]|nr:hypothetical protein LTR86_010566 [Recurvomyces mirabilis]
MPAYVIYINGWPGVGKLAVARALQPLIPSSQILHNHDLIDPVEKRYPRGHGLYQKKRSEYRQQRLRPMMKDPELKDTVFIFTDSQTEHNDCMGDYTDLALGEDGRRFYSVILHCEQAENERRLQLPGRGGGINGKLTDVGVLRRYREHGDGIWKFGDEDEVEIDVTSPSAEEAAEVVWRFVDRREREGRSWGVDDLP